MAFYAIGDGQTITERPQTQGKMAHWTKNGHGNKGQKWYFFLENTTNWDSEMGHDDPPPIPY